jgi:protein gp37
VGEETKIQWCHHTFNPWMGCAKVHAGCTHCYAEKALPVTMRTGGKLQWGEVWQGGQRVVKADSGWREPLKWARDAARAGERRRVFCASLADVLEVPADAPAHLPLMQFADAGQRVREARAALDTARARLWDVIRQTAVMLPSGDPSMKSAVERLPNRGFHFPGLDWLLLTKRPEHWELVPEDVRPLVWLGTSISDQATADEWVPRLLKAEGFRYRFLSLEPMVGPVDLRKFMWPVCGWWRGPYLSYDEAKAAGAECGLKRQSLVGAQSRFIDWVIVGGESGTKARPCALEWVRDVVRQCRDAGVPVFVKQLGAHPTRGVLVESTNPREKAGSLLPFPLHDSKGGDMAEWPEDLRVREVPHG